MLKRTGMTLVPPGPLENDLVRMASDAGKRKEIETLTDCPVPLNHKPLYHLQSTGYAILLGIVRLGFENHY